MKLIDKVIKSKNPIIEGAYEDFKDFYEKEEQTDKKLIEEIEYNIYKAEQIDEDDLEFEIGCTKKDVINARKFLKEIKR